MRYLIVSMIFILGIFNSMQLFAQNFEKSTSYHEAFFLNEQTEVSVQNKYGDIQVVVWEKDSVKFEVDVIVISNKESKLDKAFGSIKMNFKNNHYFVSAKTEFVGQGGIWTDVSDISRTIFNSNTTTKVNYLIHIPKNAELHLTNKYGNIYMGNYQGELDVNLSNGDFKAHNLTGKSNIKLSYGDLFLEKLDWARFDFSYVEAHIEECTYMETKTYASKLYISQVSELNIVSGHDKYYIGSVSKISGNSKFTYLKITNLHSNISLAQRYGTLQFKNLNYEMEYFSLETYKSDIHLGLASEKAYLLDLKCIKKPHVQYTSGEFTMTEEIIDAETKMKSIKVIWGDAENKTLIPLHIHAEEGNVFIDVK